MAGKRCAIWVALVSLMSLAGCCSWCDKHCPNCHTPQACVPCCPAPAATAYPPPITPAPAPQANAWQRSYPGQFTCTCTSN